MCSWTVYMVRRFRSCRPWCSRDNTCDLHTFGALIDGCARVGQVAKAFGANGILRSKNVKQDRVVVNALISVCGQSGPVDHLFGVLAEMKAEMHLIDPDRITIGALMKACFNAGQVERVKYVY